ncbi:UPF0179 family protein [Haloarcula argentinensis]|uniref:UPF0179 protein NC662_07260 n=1 Tax=Haloarcula argentinensis TaxID=43776 RepID=A0ABU2F036_HALAR|nr:UPF0179 family protein [Haloarcula argentinensis]EMA24365.1 hypothetical protein C443_04364 [Haloarcula argentinensis DSM 12282]MDS0253521.1 UPF0179 family protein [Haloarcula argentinensis]
MTTVTLVGTRLAEAGAEFVYRGEASGCADCPYRDQCLNLTTGNRYRITNVRQSGQTLDCAMHDTGVRAVEVEPAPIQANVPSKGAYAGSKASLMGPCPHTECPSHPYCEPAGAEFDEEYRISEITGDPPHDYCMLDRDLTLVELEAPEDG